VSVERVAAADAPEGAISDPRVLVGQTLAAPIARRQVLTSLAVISTKASVADGNVLAPLRLADAELAALLHPGDVVDVLAADPQSRSAATVVQRDVPVLAIPRPDDSTPGPTSGALVVLGVSRASARILAQASVTEVLSVVLTR
jgi:hypothetical protein